MEKTKQKSYGIRSLILGITALLLSCVIIGVIPAIFGIISGMKANKQEEKKEWPYVE